MPEKIRRTEQEALNLAEERAYAMNPYRTMADNARAAGFDHVAQVLSRIARYAEKEAITIFDAQGNIDALRKPGSPLIIPEDKRDYGSTIDLREVIKPRDKHILYAAVAVAKALAREGDKSIDITNFNFQEKPKRPGQYRPAFVAWPDYSPEHPTVQKKVAEIRSMLGIISDVTIDGQSTDRPHDENYRSVTNMGLVLNTKIVRRVEDPAPGRRRFDMGSPDTIVLSVQKNIPLRRMS